MLLQPLPEHKHTHTHYTQTLIYITFTVLPVVGAVVRTPQPASALSVAQQCGGSDAFSGVTGNPVAGDSARRLIAVGGQTILAETDELIGAEAYILRAVKGTCLAPRYLYRPRTIPCLVSTDFETAASFLEIIRAFKERLAWHGQVRDDSLRLRIAHYAWHVLSLRPLKRTPLEEIRCADFITSLSSPWGQPKKSPPA